MEPNNPRECRLVAARRAIDQPCDELDGADRRRQADHVPQMLGGRPSDPGATEMAR
jgi:hypothetical protein